MVETKLHRGKEHNQEEIPEVLPSIYTYLDYRQYLRDICATKKKLNPHFSYRYLSEKVGIRSGGFFSWVLQGKRNISDRLALDLARFFKLDKHEAVYFELLVAFNQAATHEERKHAFDRLLSMRRGSVKQVDEDQGEFYRTWYYSAVRELVAVVQVTDDNCTEAAAFLLPPIKPSEFGNALAVLARLGMIRKNERGIYERSDAVISSKGHIPLVVLHDYQISSMELAKAAFDRFGRGERELSTVTMSIDNEAYMKVIERLAIFRAEVMEIARSVKEPSRIMQLNLHYFPLSHQKREAGHE